MVVPFSGAASSNGSGPSSPQNPAASPMSSDLSDPEISSDVGQIVKKPKKKNVITSKNNSFCCVYIEGRCGPEIMPQPAVDATSMIESSRPETRPCDEQKRKVKYVRDDRRTYARKHLSPDHVLSTEQLPRQPPYHFHFDDNVRLEMNLMKLQKQLKEKDQKINEKDQKINEKDNIISERDKIIGEKDKIISKRDENISDLRRKLEKEKGEKQLEEKDKIISEKDKIISDLGTLLENEKGEVCSRDNLLKERDAELATCRRNLDHCQTEIRELEERHDGASQGSISCENERLQRELDGRDAWIQQQLIAIHSYYQAQLEGWAVQYNWLWVAHQSQFANLESFDRHAHERQSELDGARQRIQALTNELRILRNQSIDVTQLGQNNGNQQHVNGGVAMNTNSGVLPDGNANNATSFVSSGNASTQAALEVPQISAFSQTDQDSTKSDAKDEHGTSVDGQALPSGDMDVHTSLETEPDSFASPSAEVEQISSRENDANTGSVQVGTINIPLKYP